MEYILSHTTEKVCITVVNRQRPKKKHRYIALDDNVKHLLSDYQKKQKIIYKSD
jgi:antibiotic biosynthesis monooxygenase (ABM) superfamily enzyme